MGSHGAETTKIPPTAARISRDTTTSAARMNIGDLILDGARSPVRFTVLHRPAARNAMTKKVETAYTSLISGETKNAERPSAAAYIATATSRPMMALRNEKLGDVIFAFRGKTNSPLNTPRVSPNTRSTV